MVLKGDITVELVERLVASQFPQWAGLPVGKVALDGWDNTTFRLGETMSVRLPSADPYAAQVDKEQRFKAGVPVEPFAWARARGWALWKALLHLAADRAKPGRGARSDRRVGWRLSSQEIVSELIDDLAA